MYFDDIYNPQLNKLSNLTILIFHINRDLINLQDKKLFLTFY